MATLEDKILNGPTVHYCDAEDDDIRHDEIEQDNLDPDVAIESGVRQLSIRDSNNLNARISPGVGEDAKWAGVSQNTGPKGVIADHRNLTRKNNLDPIDREIDELLEDDEFLQQYMRSRIAEMESQRNHVPEFGQLYHISSGDEFLKAVDKELPSVLVIVHVYVRFSKPCGAMNQCLSILAEQYKHIKFVTLDASVAGMSENFKENGVPALLAYRNGELVKSLVRLTEELDRNFETEQVRELLKTNNLI